MFQTCFNAERYDHQSVKHRWTIWSANIILCWCSKSRPWLLLRQPVRGRRMMKAWKAVHSKGQRWWQTIQVKDDISGPCKLSSEILPEYNKYSTSNHVYNALYPSREWCAHKKEYYRFSVTSMISGLRDSVIKWSNHLLELWTRFWGLICGAISIFQYWNCLWWLKHSSLSKVLSKTW